MKNIQNNIQIRGTGTSKGTGTKTFRSRNSLGFTLVELIVVITILAILGALAFTQMGGFQGNARDSDRITTLSQLDSGLELYQIKIGSYPTPEANASGLVLTGSIDTSVYAKLGVIGDSISRNLKMSKTPVDPASLDKYVYATDSTQSHYQIAATLENSVAYDLPHLTSPKIGEELTYLFSLPLFKGESEGVTRALIPQTHAATPAQARVNGNYPGYIKFLSGTTTYIANVPSLIWYATGASISLTSSPATTYFVVNKQNNLPYRFNTTDTIQNQNATQILQSVTGYSTATLILTGITSLTATGIEAQFGTSATLSPALASFGGDLTKLTTALLGTTATTGSTPTVTNATCGTANKTYLSTDTTFGSDTFCTAANSTLSGSIPTFPAAGSSVGWTCNSTSGGSNASCTATRSAPSCPSGFVLVPGSTDTSPTDPRTAGTSNGWCVMKYEASYVSFTAGNSAAYYAEPYANDYTTGHGAAAISSKGSSAPINDISHDEAQILCASSTYLKDQSSNGLSNGYLLSARLWSKIARDIEQQPINWSGNAVGNGYISRGYASYATDEPTTCDQATNASRACSSLAVDPSTNPTGYYATRAWKLSNNTWIHDFAGNLWEWYADTHDNAGNVTSTYYSNDNTQRTVLGGAISTTPATNYGSNIAEAVSTGRGLGYTYNANVGAAATYAAVFGGGWYATSTAGVFASYWNANSPSTDRYIYVGFRCVVPAQ